MTPDHERALAQYRHAAARYDRSTRVLERYRREAIDLLQLTRGVTVIDVACGTGVNFGRLENSVGPTGQIIGIDVSPAMLTQASRRVAEHSWRNVTLIQVPAQNAAIPSEADAALFSFTTDVLATPEAIDNVLRHVRSGGRIALVGIRSPAGWINPLARILGRHYANSFAHFDRPWRPLQHRLDDFHIHTRALGILYTAIGHRR